GDGPDDTSGPGGNREPGGPGGPARPAGPPATVIAVVSHSALVRGHVEAGETCVIDGVGPVPVATVRAMTADAFLAAIVTDSTDIRAVAHTGRQVTARQRTALIVRDPHCVVPACSVRTGLEIDHVAAWSPTKITTLDQLARLCKHHHHQKTYDGYSLSGPPGQWTWSAPTTPSPADNHNTGPPGPEPTTLFGP
nr:HNH endonuclease [Actinomycetota bacterium]